MKQLQAVKAPVGNKRYFVSVGYKGKSMTEKEADELIVLIENAPEMLEFAKSFSSILANGEMSIIAENGFNKKVADMVGANVKIIQKRLT